MLSHLYTRDAIPEVNNVSNLLATTGTLTGFSLFVVVLRFYVRTFMLKNLGADDGVMALVASCAVTVLVFWILETRTGIGWHIDDVSLEQQTHMTKLMFAHGVVNMNAVTFVKISVALNLRRFMQAKRERIFLMGLIVFLILFTIICSCTIIFNCLPVQANWDRSIEGAKCFSLTTFKALAINNSCFNVITDFLLALMPIPLIINLKTNLRTKLSLGFILGLGLFAGSAAIVKAVKQLQFFTIRDYTWDADYWIWHDIELNVGIVAASLPALRPLFARFYDKTRKYAYDRYGAVSGARYGGQHAYGQAYGKGTRDQYQRHGNKIDGGIAAQDYKLRSLNDCGVLAGKQDPAYVRTTELYAEDGNPRKRSQAEDSIGDPGNDYDSDEIILGRKRSIELPIEHGSPEETSHSITKTTTVHIHRV